MCWDVLNHQFWCRHLTTQRVIWTLLCCLRMKMTIEISCWILMQFSWVMMIINHQDYHQVLCKPDLAGKHLELWHLWDINTTYMSPYLCCWTSMRSPMCAEVGMAWYSPTAYLCFHDGPSVYCRIFAFVTLSKHLIQGLSEMISTD